MFCNSGLCACLTSYIAAESYCYQKIDPGQPGCVYNEQCSSVWPDAFCDTSAGVGTCRCGENKVERATRDGHVCLDMLDANQNVLAITCPLPEGAGYTSALSDSKHPRQSNNPGPVLCNTESLVTHQSGEEAGDGSAGCLFPSDGAYVADLYDCVGFVSPVDLTSSGYSDKANGICCPNRAFTCIQPTATGPNPTEPRWWYNAITGMCQQFLWDPTAVGPGEHSPNNFKTIEHCESFCRDGCTRGAPEYESRSSFLEETPVTGCSQATTCSNNFECKTVGSSQWCCPSVVSVCGPVGGRPQDTSVHSRGTVYHVGAQKQGTAPSTRFFYDPASGKCSPFTYLGAGGNYNNFLSRIDCELYCARLQCDRGNPLRIGDVTQSCQTNNDCPSSHECKADQAVCCPRMRCQGNDNNFETLVDCQTFCRNASPEPRCLQGQAYKDNSGKFVTCSTNRAASSCPVNYECHYDGSMFGCCPSKAFTCSLAPNQGKTCGPGVSFKFFYNAQTQECESFEYLGCDGNSNTFASRQECESYCGVGGCANGGVPLRESSGAIQTCSEKSGGCPSTHECQAPISADSHLNRDPPSALADRQLSQGQACTAGDVVYVNPNTQTPISCNDEIRNNCPKNFQCVFDSLTDISVCCGATDMGVCPEGEKAYINAIDMTVRECLINEPNSCPTNYLCRFNASKNRYFCCGSTKSSYCPTGRAPYKDQMSTQAMRCTMSAHVSTCPDGFECQSDVRDALQGYCCSVSDICPHKEEYYVDETSGMPRSCSIGHFVTCPAGFTCMTQSEGVSGYCCRGKPHLMPSDGCPPGEIVFMDKNEPMDARHVKSHSPTSLLVNHRSARQPACRVHPDISVSSVNRTSSFNVAAFRVTVLLLWYARIVSTGITFLRFVTVQQVAFIGMSGEHQRCSMSGGQACPEGFTCVKGRNNEEICCAGGEACDSTQVSVNGRCLSVQHIGSKCEHDSQCLGESICSDGFCRCPVGTVEQKQRCVAAVKGGQMQRFLKSYEVHREALECAPNQVLFDDECLPMVSLGRACVHSIQCKGGGYCAEGVCDCPSNTVRKYDRCEKKPIPVSSTAPTTSFRPTIEGSTDHNRDNSNTMAITASLNVCKSGETLLYPRTGQPVICSRTKQCPSGYVCKRNQDTHLSYCCTVPKPLAMDQYISRVNALAKKKGLAQKAISFFAPPRKVSKGLCPRNLVLLEVEIGSKLIRRCQPTCPSPMRVVRGVCRKHEKIIQDSSGRPPDSTSAKNLA
ncbi:Kunitz/Bovine pancreatic trypsin inhibitor domain protein [Ancylostoma ceylanicum]|uniref:Kunitz/Bovine pancreatic trypsin inhibitor domain protein n=1 Tax=Ancylostoma ceylanicum TaxID=53326 RepID=A0A0D6LAN4_9BILA|nr:Kunitz/Bovine pancreatic trypsin inhibitor domain protein [Ancylostoma ceylanicum]